MLKNFTIIVFYILLELGINHAEKYKKCNPHSLPDCPINSTCVQISEDTGGCQCLDPYVFNSSHKNYTEYCTFKVQQQQQSGPGTRNNNGTTAAITPPLAVTTGSLSSTSSDKTFSAISQHQQPGSHHILGGILIPIGFVLIIVGAVYLVKRMNLVRRAREMLISRRNRPFYEDVMMSNDNDDPPLI